MFSNSSVATQLFDVAGRSHQIQVKLHLTGIGTAAANRTDGVGARQAYADARARQPGRGLNAWR